MSRAKQSLIVMTMLLLPACGDDPDAEKSRILLAGSASERGRAAIERYGCASCHTIPWIQGADALVGPPLDRIASRAYIAGVLENTPENMIRWVKDPPGVDALTAMPNLRVTDADARDIAGFLYTLR
jgi:cytochrome c551/c552